MTDHRRLASGHHLITRLHLSDPDVEKLRSRAISLRASADQLRRDVEARAWLDPIVKREALTRATEYDVESAAIDRHLAERERARP